MKQKFWFPIAAVLMLAAVSTSAFADLNAQAIVNTFNNMNPSAARRGYSFTFFSQAGGNSLQRTVGREVANTTAYTSSYASDRNTYFRSFCVNPNANIVSGSDYVGTLNYQNDGSTKTGTNVALTLGAAYLYKEFATSLNPLGVGNMSAALYTQMQNAIYALMGLQSISNWATNTYLNRLLQLDTRDHWTQTYYANQQYAEIGSYSVFVMNVTTTAGVVAQDHLYIAPATTIPTPPTPGVPEPATLLLWSLGGLGLVGSWARKRHKK